MIVQAFEYEQSHKEPRKLQEFFAATEGKFRHPDVKRWVQELLLKRDQFESSFKNGETRIKEA